MADQDELELAHAFREKAIALRGMDRGLLLLTVLAMGVVVLAALLVATEELPWPRLAATVGSPPLTIPLPVLVGCSLFLVLAWAYLLTGALHAHLALRVIGLLAWTLGMSTLIVAAPSPIGFAALGLLALATWAAAIAMWLVDRLAHDRGHPERHHRHRLRVLTFGFLAAVTAALFAIGALGGLRSGALAFSIQVQLGALQFLLIPMLYLAGTDFAEWSEVVAGRVGSALTGVGGNLATWVTAGALAIAAVLIVVDRLRTPGALPAMAEALVPLAVIGAVGAVAIRRRAAGIVPFSALVAAGLVGVGSLLLGSWLQCQLGYCTATRDVAYTHQRAPVFTIDHDPALTPSARPAPGGGEAVVFHGTDPTGLPVRFVVLSARAGDPLTSQLPPLLGGPVTVTAERGREGGWNVRDYGTRLQGTRYQGRAWTRAEGGERWLLAGVSPLIAGGAYDAPFQRMVTSWEPTASAPERQEGANVDLTLAFGFTIAAFLFVVLFAVAVPLLRRGGVAATAGLFIVAAGVFFLANGVRYVLAVFTGGESPLPSWIVAQGVPNTTGTIAACALAVLTFLVATRRVTAAWAPLLRLLLVLLLGLVGLRLIYTYVFGAAIHSGEGLPVIQGLVLMLALLWDVAMSGESLTNRHGRHVPRHSRVLMYLGYTMLVATAVLFFSALEGPGAESVSPFESDFYPQFGIVAMGVPLVLTFFLVNLGAWLRRRSAGDPPLPPDRVTFSRSVTASQPSRTRP